jgi:UDP-N-acetylmuramate--alanine ligase
MPADPRPWRGRALHVIGVGGAGMSGVALLAHALGARVTGSDRAESPYLARVRAAGIPVAVGPHDAAHVPPEAEVVHSTAVPPGNPERAVARERGQPELPRAALLGELSALRRTIAVAGTHGKTTTASMAVHALRGTGADPSYLVGGEVRSTGANAAWGSGELLVVEADESDRSMLALQPEIAVVTNAELDHHATFASRLEVEEAFAALLRLAPRGVLWAGGGLGRLRPAGTEVALVEPEDVRLQPGGSVFGWRGVPVRLAVPGLHNARNAALALEACALAGADPERAAAALADFRGAGRRFERLGTTPSGAAVVDDYAHHPTEVRATLEAARTLRPRRLVAVFQPHLFSRTRALAREFGAALALADLVVVLPIYRAREDPEDFPGVTGRLVAAATADAAPGRPVAWLPTFATARAFLDGELREGDLCLVLGAGDVDRLGRALVGEGPGAPAPL